MAKSLELPGSTGACEYGPIAHFDSAARTLTITYDNADENPVAWAVVEFSGVIACRFLMANEASLLPIETGAFGLHVAEETDWINEMKAAHRENINAAAAANLKIKHYYMDFDHFGYVEVLAEGCAARKTPGPGK